MPTGWGGEGEGGNRGVAQSRTGLGRGGRDEGSVDSLSPGCAPGAQLRSHRLQIWAPVDATSKGWAQDAGTWWVRAWIVF